MLFEKIIGHSETLSLFEEWILNDAFEGVYLFHGPRGVGKYTIARELSKSIICNGVQDSTCRCNSCKLFPNSPDFLEIDSETGKVIKTADVQDVEEFMDLLPFKGRKKVLLIDDAERFNRTSANQLLKVFEDIKSHVVVILVSSAPERIIPTILSRTTQVQFSGLNPQAIAHILKEMGHKSGNIESFKKAIPVLSGSILSSFDDYNQCYGWVSEFVSSFHNTQEDDLLSTLDRWNDSEEKLQHCLEILLIYVSDILRINLDDKDTVFNSDKTDLLENLSLSWNMMMCITALEKIRPVILDYKKGVNIRLLPRFKSVVSWLYLFAQKDKKKDGR